VTGHGGERTVQLSVFDRLLVDEETKEVAEPRSWHESVRLLKQGLLRDLEWLLNTHRLDPAVGADPDAPPPVVGPELARSVFAFGLPDITAVPRDSAEEQRYLARRVQDTIALFEPRLANVRVTLVAAPSEARRELRFLVEGTLRIEPSPEQVAFDTVLELATGEVVVQGARDA
jgi:type VI secretion system protein ImpF